MHTFTRRMVDYDILRFKEKLKILQSSVKIVFKKIKLFFQLHAESLGRRDIIFICILSNNEIVLSVII